MNAPARPATPLGNENQGEPAQPIPIPNARPITIYNLRMVTRQRIIFQGRVQGVGFRVRARNAAMQFPVTGWVRNEPDGTVMLEAQGAENDLDAFLAELRRKTSGLVEREVHAHVRTESDEQQFEIRRH